VVHSDLRSDGLDRAMANHELLYVDMHHQGKHDIRYVAIQVRGCPLFQVYIPSNYRRNGTWMSSFLVNSFTMLLTSLGLISFLTLEFETYLRFTVVERIYRHLLTNAAIVKYVYYYDLTEFGLVIVFLLFTGYLLSIPSQKSRINKLMQQKKKERMEMNKVQDDN
jgi:hypothetical protein